ncbi:MAG TPA: nuclear transport factor 2 family protein [Flavisolibacter sp.]
MKHLLTALFLLFCSIVSAQKDNTAIRELTKDMETAFNSRDMLKVSALYLDSAGISGGRQYITGRNNIDNYWLSLKDRNAEWKLETDGIEDYGDVVLQRGRSYLTFKSGETQRQSNVRFLLVWKKTGQSYKILYDYFSGL